MRPIGRSIDAFTLTELIITVVIVGVIAGFAVPNYRKSVERTYYQDAVMQLRSIHAANKLYAARDDDGDYWPPANNQDVTTINNNLSLNIMGNGMTYTCGIGAGPAGSTFTCTAVRFPGSAFTVTVTQADLSAANPACTAGSCP